MVRVGIDLSLRSSGVCVYNTETKEVNFKLVTPCPKVYNDEKLLEYISQEILEFIFKFHPNQVNLEGLSFGSISGSKDIIAGNFWYCRCQMKKVCNELNIVPVTSWRSPLFSKEERKKMKECTSQIKELREECKGLSLTERRKFAIDHEEIILNSNVKHQTYLKVPSDILKEIKKFPLAGRYDLSDAFHICLFDK